jgi:hypothetical protein
MYFPKATTFAERGRGYDEYEVVRRSYDEYGVSF